MASKKISQLPGAAPLSGGELLAGLQSGGDVGVTTAQIAAYSAVASVSALAARSTGAGATNLTDPIRGGIFVWKPGNFTTQVASDPGQGIYVATASDPTGALGAQVRQWDGVHSNAGWWGYTPDATATVDPWGLLAFSTTGSGSSGQPVLTLVSMAGIVPGLRCSGTGLSDFAGTFTSNNIILSVNVGASQITLNRNLIGNISSGTLTFQGPVSGTGTDNSVALINIGKWGRTQTSVDITFPTGTALWNGHTTSGSDANPINNAALSWTTGIKNLTIRGYGAIWQNTYNQAISGADSGSGTVIPLSGRVEIEGFLINTTAVGDTSFSVINSADVATANVQPGDTVFLACNDQQFLGYPANPGRFEPVTVSSIVGTTYNILGSIKYVYNADYPDYNATPGINSTAGAARMWVMPDPAWQGTQRIVGLQTNLSPGMPQGFYATLSKLNVITQDWIGPGFSETITRRAYHLNPTVMTDGELDKFVDDAIYINPQGPGAIPLQSSNPNRLIIDGGDFGGVVGCAKQMLIRGAKMATFLPSARYGMSTSTVLDGCDVSSAPGTSVGNVTDGALLNPIDGTVVTFANGIITIDALASAVAGTIGNWGVTRGMWCNLQASTVNGFSNDLGTGLILNNTWNPFALAFGTTTATGGAGGSINITVTSTAGIVAGMGISGTGIAAGAVVNIVFPPFLVLSLPNTGTVSGALTLTKPTITITTTLTQFATLPSWATGSIYLFKVNEVVARKCIGDASIRQMSDANDVGQRYFEYRRFELAGITGTSMFVDNPTGCQLMEVDVNIVVPHTAANSTLVINPTTVQTPSMTNDSGGTAITIRLDIAGTRKITQSEWVGYPVGAATLDHITVGGSASSYLPTGRIVGPTTAIAMPASSVAVGEVIMKFSAGIVRKPLTRQYDDSGTISSAKALIAMNGSLP